MLLPATTLRLVPKLPVFDYLFFPLPTNDSRKNKKFSINAPKNFRATTGECRCAKFLGAFIESLWVACRTKVRGQVSRELSDLNLIVWTVRTCKRPER